MLKITKLFLAGLLLVVGVSCKGQWISTFEYESYTEARTVQCHTLGYCRSCVWMHMYHFCSYGPYNRCPGTREILVKVTPENGYYVNHPTKIVKRERIHFLREVTPCKVRAVFMLQEDQYQLRKPEG
jgi:hypothetical protein